MQNCMKGSGNCARCYAKQCVSLTGLSKNKICCINGNGVFFLRGDELDAVAIYFGCCKIVGILDKNGEVFSQR